MKSYRRGCTDDVSISALGIGSNGESELPKAQRRGWTNGWEEVVFKLLECTAELPDSGMVTASI